MRSDITEKEKKRVSANRAFKLILNDSLQSVAKEGLSSQNIPFDKGCKETMFYRRSQECEREELGVTGNLIHRKKMMTQKYYIHSLKISHTRCILIIFMPRFPLPTLPGPTHFLFLGSSDSHAPPNTPPNTMLFKNPTEYN